MCSKDIVNCSEMKDGKDDVIYQIPELPGRLGARIG